MKKIKLSILIICFIGIVLASTWAAGTVRLGLEFGDPNAVAIIRLNAIDLKIGYSLYGLANQGDDNFIHVSADYRIVQTGLIDFLNIYLGAGLYAQVYTGGTGNFRFGGRLPVGLNMFLLKNVLEIFLEVVPTISFLPGIAWSGFQGYLGFTIPLPK